MSSIELQLPSTVQCIALAGCRILPLIKPSNFLRCPKLPNEVQPGQKAASHCIRTTEKLHIPGVTFVTPGLLRDTLNGRGSVQLEGHEVEILRTCP